MITTTDEITMLGEVFKSKRLEKNLSLKEVENVTSIRTHYLAAIEEGQLNKLISPIYAQGFIKRYASFLDLDGENLLRQYPSVMRLLAKVEEGLEANYQSFGSIESRNPPSQEARWIPNFLWIALSVLIIGTFWFLARYMGVI